jgi:small subunit ribosomal protein S2
VKEDKYEIPAFAGMTTKYMEDITLQALLEAGCHFGHKSERWHPKAAKFIYTEKDGIHIIDLAKTKIGLDAAREYVKKTVEDGGELLVVGTKRQARGIVKQEAEAVGAPYFSERWIGGFLTNWDQVKKNIEKINRMSEEQAAGAWKKFPKHEQTKMARYLERIKVYYGGVLHLHGVPSALFIVDVRKEVAAVREAARCGVPVIGLVDTNSDPTAIDYVIPANDDAVGSITYVVHAIAEAYKEGKDVRQKQIDTAAAKEAKQKEAKQVEEKKKEAVQSKEEKGEKKT